MVPQPNPTPADKEAPDQESVHKMAENPNPRANENIQQTPFEEKRDDAPGGAVGTEITDGEAG